MADNQKKKLGLTDLSFKDWYSLDKADPDYKEKSAIKNQAIIAGKSFFSAMSKISQGMDDAFRLDMQAAINQNNASLLRNNEFLIEKNFQENINDIQRQGKVFKGGQIEQMSASGFEVSSASYQNLLDNTDFEIAKNVAALKMSEETAKAQNKYNYQMSDLQASLYRKSAKRAKRNVYIEGAMEIGKMFL